MNIDQIYTGCLAQGAYYIESNGEAVIIDPLREVQPYIDRAEKDGAENRPYRQSRLLSCGQCPRKGHAFNLGCDGGAL